MFYSIHYITASKKTKEIKMKRIILALVILSLGVCLSAQDKDLWTADNFSGLKFRSIGPAFMSGRIADIAIHPENESIWYIAVGSGGVWKTENAGNTWIPLFDKESCYSTGCITLDPQNPSVVWLGTGENVGGRHVSFGDGIYKSADGGATWSNMGLKIQNIFLRSSYIRLTVILCGLLLKVLFGVKAVSGVST